MLTRARRPFMRCPGLLGLLALLAVALCARRAAAQELEELNPMLAAQVHLKVISYDRSLQARSQGKLVLAVLFRPDREESERARAAMQAAFSERAGKSSVQGMQLLVTSLALGDPKTLTKRLQDLKATLLYVTPGLEDQAAVVSAAAQVLKAPTLTGSHRLLDAGMAIAVVTKEDKPGIVINLPVARSLGMDLDTTLLRLAEVKK